MSICTNWWVVYNNNVILFGGIANRKRIDKVEMFCLSTLDNKQIDHFAQAYPITNPLEVVGHSAVVFKQHMWIFGSNKSYGTSLVWLTCWQILCFFSNVNWVQMISFQVVLHIIQFPILLLQDVHFNNFTISNNCRQSYSSDTQREYVDFWR